MIHYRDLPDTAAGKVIRALYLRTEFLGRGLTLQEFSLLGHDKRSIAKLVKEGILRDCGYIKLHSTGQYIKTWRFNIMPLRWYERLYWRVRRLCQRLHRQMS